MRPSRWLPFVLTALLAVPPAFAQDATVTGTVAGTVGGDALAWTTLRFETADGVQHTAELEDYGFVVALTLQAHVEPRFVLDRALVVSVEIPGSLAACPCTVTEFELFYLLEGSMFSNVHRTEEGTFVLESATLRDDGLWHLVGRVAVDAPFYAQAIGGEPDLDRVLTIEATFDVVAAASE